VAKSPPHDHAEHGEAEHSHASMPKWGMKNMPITITRMAKTVTSDHEHADKKDAEMTMPCCRMAMRNMQGRSPKMMITQATITPHTIMRAMTTRITIMTMPTRRTIASSSAR